MKKSVCTDQHSGRASRIAPVDQRGGHGTRTVPQRLKTDVEARPLARQQDKFFTTAKGGR